MRRRAPPDASEFAVLAQKNRGYIRPILPFEIVAVIINHAGLWYQKMNVLASLLIALLMVCALLLAGWLVARRLKKRPKPVTSETAMDGNARDVPLGTIFGLPLPSMPSGNVPDSFEAHDSLDCPEFEAKESRQPYADENVQFTVYRPSEVKPGVWHPFLAFAHLSAPPPDAGPDEPDPVQEVTRQAQALLGASVEKYQRLVQDSGQTVPRDGELTFVPEVPGLEFDPPQRSFVWRQPVHRETFLLRAPASASERIARGRMAVFLGRILLAEVPLNIPVRVGNRPRNQAPAMETETACRYRRIFASYSHKDAPVVQEFERYARVLGDEYLRDVVSLRAGEVWTDRLGSLIDDADIFQLFWSWNSIDSPFVRAEWEHAVLLGRAGFIRPVYWEDPLPNRPEQGLPPDVLRKLHFHKLPSRAAARDLSTADEFGDLYEFKLGRPEQGAFQRGPEEFTEIKQAKAPMQQDSPQYPPPPAGRTVLRPSTEPPQLDMGEKPVPGSVAVPKPNARLAKTMRASRSERFDAGDITKYWAQDVPEGLVSVIEIQTPSGLARIELHLGDLTAMQPDDAVDVLVVSSFPDDYVPTEGSLIGALSRKGISVAELAGRKQVDLRDAFSCWLSPEIPVDIAGIHFKRILCFEPHYRGTTAPEAVGDIFRSLAPFVAGDPHVSSIAMPVLSAGAQGYEVNEILPSLLESAAEWLKIGLPLRTIKIFAHGQHQAVQARRIFDKAQATLQRGRDGQVAGARYDAFISYARQDSAAALAMAQFLKAQQRTVFLDQLELDHGSAWQQHIFEALDRATKIIVVYSPDYARSKVCQEEFNIAWARGRKMSAGIIFPIYWRSGNLPTYMEMLNFADCRERREDKLEKVCAALAHSLKPR